MAWDTSARHGTSWKPKGYTRLRAERFAAYGNQCIDCGSAEDLELDHLDGDRDNWDPANLGPRCHPCHTRKTQTEAAQGRLRRSTRRTLPPHPSLR